MSLRYDLHTHSNASDGILSPGELLEQASQSGIHYLALTDHDSTQGLAEAESAVRALPTLELVPGVEISVTWNGRLINIVGLGIDRHSPTLENGLNILQKKRSTRAFGIAARLENLGIQNAYESAVHYAPGNNISRTHFARLLVDRGRASNLRKAFQNFLRPGGPAYVDCQWASLDQAVDWIVQAGGVAVVAHPARYKLGLQKLRGLLGEFKECGGRAIEVVGSGYSPNVANVMARLAKEFDLLASVGSDFHDPGNCHPKLGRLPGLPRGCRPVWDVLALP